MPYRRLPNTDQARIRALKAVVAKADTHNLYDLAVSLKTLTEARNFLMRFEAAQSYYVQCFERQSQAGRKHQANVKMARLYISHFIQVLNLAVIRSEVRAAHKSYYGLPTDSSNVPDLSTEAALVEWGRKIIDGETKRTSQGGIPIYNPTIAKVRVHYDIFTDSYDRQKNLQALTARSLDSLSTMRTTADELILDIWNQVEKKFEDVSPNEKRLELCRDYGLIYYYRTGEKRIEKSKRMRLIDTHSHLFLEEFSEDFPQVIERARAAGVTHIFMPNIDSTTIEAMLSACSVYKGYCFPMIGLHPTSVNDNYEKELEIVARELKFSKEYVAIGEIGMDLYWDKTYLKEQQIVLDKQVNWALEYDLPIVIHCRDAFDYIYKVLEPYKRLL